MSYNFSWFARFENKIYSVVIKSIPTHFDKTISMTNSLYEHEIQQLYLCLDVIMLYLKQ